MEVQRPPLGTRGRFGRDLKLPRKRLVEGVQEVSRLGLSGTFGLSADDVERAFHELSINYFFVTSRGDGVQEGVRRIVADGHRDQIVIAAGANIPIGASVRLEFRRICRLLGVESIDVFHLFWIQAHWYVTGKTWPAMRELKEKGLAKSLAISCHDRPMARALVDELGLDALMIRYNAAHRGAEKEIFESLPETKRPGIIAFTATRWGGLLKPHSGLEPMTGPECYRFALQHPKVDVVLTGPRSFTELEENVLGVMEGPLAEPRLEEIRRFGDAVRAGKKFGW